MDGANKRKAYVKIGAETSSDEIFAILDSIESDNEEDIENLLDDSDTEFVYDESINRPISEDKNMKKTESVPMQPLVPEAVIHIENPQPNEDIVLKTTAKSKSGTDGGRKRIAQQSEEQPTSSKKIVDKDSLPAQAEKKKKENEKKDEILLKWTKKGKKKNKQETCYLYEDVTLEMPEYATLLRIFEETLNLDALIDMIVEQSNLYAVQNGREFKTNAEEIRAFLGTNFIMTICKLPTLKCYWMADDFITNDGIRNIITRDRFMDILKNLHFNNNFETDPSDRGYKIRSLIDHLNAAFQAAMSDASKQSIDEHMTKFKGRHSSKQYIKNKPIKWGFKWWCRCSSVTGYLYQFDLYLGKKESTEFGLGESVVLQLTESLKDTYCTIFCDNFFTSPNLVHTLLSKGIYCYGTVRSNRKNMPQLIEDNKMKRGDHQFMYTDKEVAVKWFDNRGVTIIGSSLEGTDEVSSILRRCKGQSSKVSVPCPTLIKDYNSNMGGVDLLDQKTAAYKLDRKSSGGRYYLRLFFDLMDMACVNAHIVYKNLNPRGMELLDFKIVIGKSLIGCYSSRARNVSQARCSKRSVLPAAVPLHLPVVLNTRSKCVYCSSEGKENKTFIHCGTCNNKPLCIVTGANARNCFAMYHTDI